MKTAFALLLLTAFTCSGCSYLTSRGRAEAAYARYVRHASASRTKLQRRFTSYPTLPSAQPIGDAQVSAGPESVTVAGDAQ
ncbi:MAG: hypothetical protein JO354_14585 [Verrucomicrobia bacterium]|nr:hypothetical protein [Verrucomicrobiota bacterium]